MNKLLAFGFEKLACRTNYLGQMMSKYRLEDAVETFAKATQSTPVHKVANRYKNSEDVSTYIFEKTGNVYSNQAYTKFNSFPSNEDWKLWDEIKKFF